jgi:hypothetical protein
MEVPAQALEVLNSANSSKIYFTKFILSLAEMVRSSNIMKQPSFQKKGDGSLTS